MRIVHIPRKNRLHDSREHIRNAFSSVNCLECRECCRTRTDKFRTFVAIDDPNYNAIIKAAFARSPGSLIGMPNTNFYLLGKEHCVFAEFDGGRRWCTIYNIRPIVCRESPLVEARVEVPTIYGEGIVYDRIVVASSLCPPVLSLKQSGVTYIAKSDVLATDHPKEERAHQYMVPILSYAMTTVLSHASNKSFTSMRRHIVFLIT